MFKIGDLAQFRTRPDQKVVVIGFTLLRRKAIVAYVPILTRFVEKVFPCELENVPE